MDVGVSLRSLGLGRYDAAFIDNSIEADVLPDLTDGDLAQPGVNLGDRKRLLKAIASQSATEAATKPASPAPLFSSTVRRMSAGRGGGAFDRGDRPARPDRDFPRALHCQGADRRCGQIGWREDEPLHGCLMRAPHPPRRGHCSSSSSALAATRSGVSKPSVNQP
jgi:hypothetical protein